MDSCNSGSMQSSSGGDDDYDSRAAADSVFTRPPPVFDPVLNYVQLHQDPNPALIFNTNMVWPGTTGPRSDPNPTFGSPFQPPATAIGADNNNNNKNNNHGVTTTARNPKKRSRASRRAPTTVLTTDTTNFRAMVQEFTGIPSPPFNNSSLTRTRLDLVGTRSTAVDVPPYLRRPFTQKVQSPAFLASSTTTNNNSISTQSLNVYNNIQNPILTSFLQTNPKFVFSNSSTMASSKPSFEIPSNDVKIGGLQEFDLSHVTTLSGLPNLISSDQIAAHNDQNDNTNDNNARNWRSTNGVSLDEGDDYEAQMRSINGGYNFPRNSTNGKTNYSATSSDFQGQKGPENIATRGEGIVESWINCTSE